MMYRLALRIETDEAGILVARDLVKAVLEPGYGRVGSVTVEEWLFRELAALPVVLRSSIEREGDGRARGRGRRRRVG